LLTSGILPGLHKFAMIFWPPMITESQNLLTRWHKIVNSLRERNPFPATT
jgi:hypothetical protein